MMKLEVKCEKKVMTESKMNIADYFTILDYRM